MVVAGADVARGAILAHLLYTHLLMEPFAVSTLRNLPSHHVLSQLLRPHFFNTIAINDLARDVFLSRGGFFDMTGALARSGTFELLYRGYSGRGTGGYEGEPLQFYQRALPYDLAQRDVAELSHYHYRDDAVLVWNLIEAYVGRVLKACYPTAASLTQDAPVQRWKSDLVSPKYGGIQGLLPPSRAEAIEGKLTQVEDLVAIVTNVIFTATAQHSAVNFGQGDYFVTAGNAPFALYQPFTDMQRAHGERVYTPVARLPSRTRTVLQIVLSRVLSMPPPMSSDSLLTMKNPFADGPAQTAFHDFQQRLAEAEQEILQRNRQRAQPYTYLLPSRIAQSVAI